MNSILGEERVIVAPQPHTTREPIDTFLIYKDRPIILVDTAGIRKKTKIKEEIEKIGVEKSLKIIKRADIVFLMLDLSEKVSYLDRKLAGLVKKEKRGLILVINKFDLAKFNIERYIQYYQQALPTIWWAPIIFISAKEKINLEKLLELALEIKMKMEEVFNQKDLAETLYQTIKKYGFKEKFWLKTKIEQKRGIRPIFKLKIPRITKKEKPPAMAQINILEKEIRKKFALFGVPLEIKLKIKNEK